MDVAAVVSGLRAGALHAGVGVGAVVLTTMAIHNPYMLLIILPLCFTGAGARAIERGGGEAEAMTAGALVLLACSLVAAPTLAGWVQAHLVGQGAPPVARTMLTGALLGAALAGSCIAFARTGAAMAIERRTPSRTP